MIITIGGLAGTGKSTIKNLLAERLGFKAYSAGDLRGKMALERGLTIDELNAIGMSDASTDRLADEYQENLGRVEDNFVIDGWLSWHFIPHSFKVFLTVDPQEAARRIFDARRHEPQTRADEPNYKTPEEAYAVVTKRVENSLARYQKWYNLNILDQSQYDLVIDTTTKTTTEIVVEILSALRSKGLVKNVT